MAIRVLLRAYPHRSIALVAQHHALIFRHDSSTTESALINSLSSNYFAKNQIELDSASAARHVVEFLPCASAELDDYYSLSSLSIHGTLGLITINNDVFLCVVKEASKVASVRPGETVEQISSVEFYCLNKSDYDQHLGENIHPHSADGSYSYNQAERDPLLEHPCVELKKLLGNGSFYYSLDFDLTTRLQNRSAQVDSLDMDSMDQSFLWNSYMISPLVKFRSRLLKHEKEALDRSQILISAIRGFVLTLPIPSISAPLSSKKADAPSNLTLISRLSCRRAGTRFNSRGIDDDGNVANFVESETIYWSPSTSIGRESISAEKLSGICFSYVQTRGSVPVFWEQAAGLIPGQQKITITRSSEGSQPTFEKHFDELEQNYGSVHIVNLLSETKPGEAELTSLYRRAVRKTCLERTGEKCAQRQLLNETEFDFHAETKGPGGYEAASMIRKLIKNSAEEFAYYLSEGVVDSPEDSQEEPCIKTAIVFQQHGVFRTNCLDCLDRTNLIQTIISQMAVEIFLGHRGELAKPEFWVRHSTIWADNGDALSRIYAGTGALKSSFTRHGKMSFAGAIADARKSATRLYINNFADKGRQNTIDLLLGRLVGQKAAYLIDPINEFITAQLSTRRAEYETSDTIKIWCGTFNLNGRINGVDADLSSWLFPGLKASQNTPDIVTIGFQEIVELSPQQIMNSDPSRRKAWEKAVQTTLNKQGRENGTDRYILLRSGQLVGAALMIFVKKSILANIRNVEGSLKKTGLSGIAGNKGAVAIRMDYANTSICFVTAHFAAGHTNYDERNLNYNTINSGLRFQRNRGIIDHDTVIWMGDFNYRIHLGIERVKHLIDNGDLGTLFENDQLNVQMKKGLVFSSYVESKITFMPTYKFNLDEDAYDDSEKARIPAWTDRILRKGDNIRQVNYNTAPLRFSDHRPVYGTFLCTVKIIDEDQREAISRQLYDEYRAYVSTRKASTQSDNPLEDLIEYDSLDPGLSSVGSDLVNIQIPVDNSKTAYLRKNTSNNGRGSNSDRPSTSSNEESDWVTIPRSNPPHISRSITSPSLRPQDSISAIPKETNNQLSASKPPPMPARTQTNTQFFLSDKQSDAKQETKGILRSYSTDGHVSSQGSITKNNKALPIVARKPDHLTSPPIVRKPAHLSSSSLTPKTIPRATSSAVLARDSRFHSPTPENRSSYNENKFGNFYKKAGREAPTPPAFRRSGNNKLPMGAGSLASAGNHPRPIRHEETDLLGDDIDARFCEIKALKPK